MKLDLQSNFHSDPESDLVGTSLTQNRHCPRSNPDRDKDISDINISKRKSANDLTSSQIPDFTEINGIKFLKKKLISERTSTKWAFKL